MNFDDIKQEIKQTSKYEELLSEDQENYLLDSALQEYSKVFNSWYKINKAENEKFEVKDYITNITAKDAYNQSISVTEEIIDNKKYYKPVADTFQDCITYPINYFIFCDFHKLYYTYKNPNYEVSSDDYVITIEDYANVKNIYRYRRMILEAQLETAANNGLGASWQIADPNALTQELNTLLEKIQKQGLPPPMVF